VPAPVAPAAANIINGSATFSVDTATNAITGTMTITGDFGRVVAAHIHDGDIGVAGPVVVPLVDSGNGIWVVQAGTVLSAAQTADFIAGGYYVNAHTALNTAGEIRGQLGSAVSTTKTTTLTSVAEVPAPVAPAAANIINGSATFSVNPATNAITGTMTITGDFGRVVAAHIHDGDVGVAGPVVVPLVDSGNGIWVVQAGTVLSAAQTADFIAGGYYVNAHTALNTAGEIRGQLNN
jgi:uncharacterized Zn-binding protein involved in type VI secretion